ncbi:aldolase/citrate lyase family protein [Amylibacter sp.]|nr:aldolase/citrate lyase family protein [Amylibacter sp.]
MELAKNKFTHAVISGEKQVGLWVTLASSFVSEVTAHSGYDWAVIDMEHSPNDYFSVLGQLQAFNASETTALVRPEWNDPVIIKRLLDLGAPGFVFPMIETVEEAKKAVFATRYPPRGVRGVSGSSRATKFGRINNYMTKIEDEISVILQIESAAAISRAVEIGSVDGVTGVFFGPSDIAADLGLLGQPMHKDVWALIKPVAQKLISKGIPVGTLVLDSDFAAELLNEGFTFVASAVDSDLLAKASDFALNSVKEKLL